MEELSLDNILNENQIDDLFETTVVEEPSNTTENENEGEENNNENNEEISATEVKPEDFFEGEPESVGSEEKSEKNTVGNKDNGSSNLFSSIANALVEDGVLSVSDYDFDSIKDAGSFSDFINSEIKSRLDETQKRISEALDANVEPSDIQKYESVIKYLDTVTEEALAEESEQGENLRRQMLYYSYINSGKTKDRAEKLVERAIENGTDIEDAKEALVDNKEFYKTQYKALVDNAREEQRNAIEEQMKMAEDFEKSVMEDKNFFGDLEIDKNTRRKVYDSVMKPVYKDRETGMMMTAIQKYQNENKVDFIKNLGLIYTLTDGFKNLNGLVGNKVKKEMKSKLSELERTVNSTSRMPNGDLKFVTGVDEDPNSKLLDIDI